MAPKFPVADAHCDFLYYMLNKRFSLGKSLPNQAVSLPYMRAGGAALQFFAAWIDPDLRVSGLQQCMCLIDAYHRMLTDCADSVVPFSPEFEPDSGKIATVLTIEGGEAVMGREENLRMFYRLGARAMTLTWNAANELAHPAMSRVNRGLTKLGREIVYEMERIGMAVDVAHLSDAGIDDVLSITRRPVFSSHTNARAVSPHRRSLSDAHIRAIAERGGIVCVNYFPPQLCRRGEASIDDIVRHIVHVIKIAGVGHVALGSDFDGMAEYPRDLKNWSDVPKLLLALRQAGLGEAEVRRIAYDNLRDYIVQFY